MQQQLNPSHLDDLIYFFRLAAKRGEVTVDGELAAAFVHVLEETKQTIEICEAFVISQESAACAVAASENVIPFRPAHRPAFSDGREGGAA
jgi:hypothetical protein